MTAASVTIAGTAYVLPPLSGSGAGGGFAFALHKGGSVLLNEAIQRLAHGTPIGFVSLPAYFVRRGIDLSGVEFSDEDRATLKRYLSRSGTVFGGWRRMSASFPLPLKTETRTFLLVRDPRDVLTSLFFDMTYGATTIPNRERAAAFRESGGTDIDSFVLKHAEDFRERYQSYDKSGERAALMPRRYEDIIFNKAALLADLSAHFGIEARPGKRRRILEAIDVRPQEENAAAHVRQVAPGDYKRKLKPETIARLTERFRSILERYGYDASGT